MTSSEASEEYLPCNFEEVMTKNYFADLRRGGLPGQYIEACQRLCSTEGVLSNSLRSVVWKDMVLGLGTAPSVPYLAESIVSSTHPESRDDSNIASHAASVFDSTYPNDVANERSAVSVSRGEVGLAKPLRRCASMSQMSAASQKVGHIPSRQRSTSQPFRTSKAFRESPSSFYPADSRDVAMSFCFPSNCQIRVVEADIKRSLWQLYTNEEQRNRMRSNLKRILLRVLASNPNRHYYQGLHELFGFVMYLLSPHLCHEELVSMCEGMLLTRWRTFSEESLRHSEALLYAMHAVIAERDPPLAMALEKCGVGPESHYAVPWVITWYAHCVGNLEVLARLFDYFITDEDGMAVIFFTSVFVLSQKKRILNWIDEAHDEMSSSGFDKCDEIAVMAKVYAQMVKMPSEALDSISLVDLNKLIECAIQVGVDCRDVVHREQANFINGKVCKLGFLANQRTRNAALKLLWYLLPREWRNPVSNRSLIQRVLLAGAAAIMATAALCKCGNINFKSAP